MPSLSGSRLSYAYWSRTPTRYRSDRRQREQCAPAARRTRRRDEQMIDSIGNVTQLNEWLAEHNLSGHWLGMPRPAEMKPWLWKWSEVYAALIKATEVVPMSDTARRTIQLRNPSLGDRMSNTIHMSVQCVLPGEVAKAHRHNAAAIRFVLQGNPDAATVVEGEPYPMGEGDLITTPGWTFHDHYNNGSEPVMWVDGLDVRLVGIARMLGGPFPADTQPIRRPPGYSTRMLGHARPSWGQSEQPVPAFRYSWADTAATLDALKESEA